MEQKFKRSFDELRNIVTMTEAIFRQEGLQADLRNVVDLATEELFVNMVTYNTESDEDILIEMLPHEHGIEVSLTDYNVARFDPTSAGNVDVDAPFLITGVLDVNGQLIMGPGEFSDVEIQVSDGSAVHLEGPDVGHLGTDVEVDELEDISGCLSLCVCCGPPLVPACLHNLRNGFFQPLLLHAHLT